LYFRGLINVEGFAYRIAQELEYKSISFEHSSRGTGGSTWRQIAQPGH
jgi:hypothetical protein